MTNPHDDVPPADATIEGLIDWWLDRFLEDYTEPVGGSGGSQPE